VHEADVTISGSGVLEIVQSPASAGLKPLPRITTLIPLLPDVGLRKIVGVGNTTVKVAVAKSPVLPKTFMVYVPRAAPAFTVKLVPVNWPPDNVQPTGVITDVGLLEITHEAASAGLKPLPVMVTADEPRPDVGLRKIVGVGNTTVKVAVAKSPFVPKTSIVCKPSAGEEATMNEAPDN
jgi:hypothetical protein